LKQKFLSLCFEPFFFNLLFTHWPFHPEGFALFFGKKIKPQNLGSWRSFFAADKTTNFNILDRCHPFFSNRPVGQSSTGLPVAE